MDARHGRAARWLHLVTFAAACYNVGAVALAQMGWGLWRHVGRAEFPAYHRAWFRGIVPTIWPMATVAGVGALAQLRWRPAGASARLAWFGALLQAANFGLTGAWWAPGQARLEQVRREDGSLDPRYTRLLRTHWARVGLIVAFALVQARMAVGEREP